MHCGLDLKSNTNFSLPGKFDLPLVSVLKVILPFLQTICANASMTIKLNPGHEDGPCAGPHVENLLLGARAPQGSTATV